MGLLEVFQNKDLATCLIRLLSDGDVFRLRQVSKELNFLITKKLNLFWAKVYYQLRRVVLSLESPIRKHKEHTKFLIRSLDFLEIPNIKCISNLKGKDVNKKMKSDPQYEEWRKNALEMLPENNPQFWERYISKVCKTLRERGDIRSNHRSKVTSDEYPICVFCNKKFEHSVSEHILYFTKHGFEQRLECEEFVDTYCRMRWIEKNAWKKCSKIECHPKVCTYDNVSIQFDPKLNYYRYCMREMMNDFKEMRAAKKNICVTATKIYEKKLKDITTAYKDSMKFRLNEIERYERVIQCLNHQLITNE